LGHFDQFPAISPSVGYLFGQETVAGATPAGRSAPLPAIRGPPGVERRSEANGFRAVLFRPGGGIPESKIVVKKGY